MFKPTRWLAAALVGALALTAIGAGVVSAKPKPKGKHDSGKVYGAITHTNGNMDFIAGSSTDKLLGAGAVTYPSTITASNGVVHLTVRPVVSWYANGSLSGTAKATLTFTATSLTIKGTLTETKGTGALKGHSFVGTFTGYSTNTDTPPAPGKGPFIFNYTGTYK
ncbi:MAG: hypothetical protein M3076_14335 [Actinomycetota bacterium]|nr:hypothetical protein [Actinomycetota bacterium]